MASTKGSASSLIRQITICSAVCVVVTFLTVSLTALWMAHRHDQEAARMTETTVRGLVETSRTRLATFTGKFARWDEVFLAVDRNDGPWLDNNIGLSLANMETVDAAAILAPDGSIRFGWTNRNSNTPVSSLITPGVLEQVSVALESEAASSGAEAMYVRSPAGVVLVSAAHILPVSQQANLSPDALPLVVLARRIDQAQLARLGSAFGVQELALVPDPPNTTAGLPLLNPQGRSVGHLTWTVSTPGTHILLDSYQVLGLGLAVFCLAMFGVSYRTRMLAMALSSSEQQAGTAARLDPLTGLMNRNAFNELISAPGSLQAVKDGAFAVIYFDLNRFKQVNEAAGHIGGDEVLRAIGARFAHIVPAGAALSRVGGDEFAVVLSGPDASRVAQTAQALLASLEEPVSTGGMEFHLTCSTGYARAVQDAPDAAAVVERANTAMYSAKKSGTREAVQFRPSMESGSRDKKTFEGHLRSGLANSELDVFYQPIGRASDCSIVGLEALVRWDSPVLGQVQTSKLVEIAEETGLIRDVGDFVLERVCRDLGRWPHLRVSINVSPVQLRDPDFISNFKRILARHDVPAERLEIELTEGVLIADPAAASRKLGQLRKLGSTIALDDFGTGFSSIGYIRTYPFDRVKIDRSFIMELDKTERGTDLVQSLISLAQAMNLQTVAEGVETAEHVRLLNLSHCDFVQGYFLHRPAPAQVMEAFVNRQSASATQTAQAAQPENVLVRLPKR